jgi:hypothetical protein
MKLTNKQLREIIRETINELEENPCWDGYEAYGTKMKNGKEVPNCVPVSELLKVRESNLPKAPVPGQIKVKLARAIEVINGAKLNYNQKLNLLFQFIDSLGLDRAMLNKMNTRIRTNLENIETDTKPNLPKAPVPGQIKVKLARAIEVINGAKLNYNQKLNLLFQFIDSLGLDRAMLNKMNTRIRTNLESSKKYESNVYRKLKEGDTEYQAYFRKELEKTGKSSPADMTDDEKKKFFTQVDKGWDGKTESVRENLSPDVAKHMNGIYKGFIKVEGDGTMVYDSPSNATKAAKYLNSKKIAASSDGKYLYIESINEGNAFGAAVTQAKKEGKKEFEFNGKKYKVKKGSYEKNEAKNKQEN